MNKHSHKIHTHTNTHTGGIKERTRKSPEFNKTRLVQSFSIFSGNFWWLNVYKYHNKVYVPQWMHRKIQCERMESRAYIQGQRNRADVDKKAE